MKLLKLSEHTPEYGTDVLVKLSTGHFTVAKLVQMYEAACGEWEEWYPSDAVESYDDNHAGTVLAAGVIEWCHLPE